MDNQTRREILGEALMDELMVIREYLEYLLPLKQRVDAIESNIIDIKSELSMMRMMHWEHQQWMKNHERHHAHIEAAH
ncbi:MAG TPA: hypothetical protein VGO07_01295 [Candidatus Saccharimonadales bacterium]|nr:hypothetical protein [Candidatus Saccharimonadales bacterium]